MDTVYSLAKSIIQTGFLRVDRFNILVFAVLTVCSTLLFVAGYATCWMTIH